MANSGHNLATRSPAERLAVTVDLIARRLIHYRKAQGKGWRIWVLGEIDKLAEHYRQPVKERLNQLLQT